LARVHGAELIAAAVEAHLPHYAATVGEVDEERAVEEQACKRWLAAAAAAADEHGVALRTDGPPRRSPGARAQWAFRHVECSVLIAT
jgi:hypothetical protein